MRRQLLIVAALAVCLVVAGAMVVVGIVGMTSLAGG
jgi:hypothetical protein